MKVLTVTPKLLENYSLEKIQLKRQNFKSKTMIVMEWILIQIQCSSNFFEGRLSEFNGFTVENVDFVRDSKPTKHYTHAVHLYIVVLHIVLYLRIICKTYLICIIKI